MTTTTTNAAPTTGGSTTGGSTTGATSTLLDVRPTAGYIGAEIHGVDLSRPLEPAVLAEIRATLLRWKVIFFRDQELTQAQHIAFGRQFGTVTPAHPTLPAAFPDHPEILLLDNKVMGGAGGEKTQTEQTETEQTETEQTHTETTGDNKGRADTPAGGGMAGGMGGGGLAIDSQWHTDVTFVPNPPMGSILRGVVVPPYGGDTQWVNLAIAYERLSEPLRTMIDGLHAVHHNQLPIRRGDMPPALAKQFLGSGLRAVHPVVRVHPETGEKALFVNPNFTSHIVELSRQESRHLLAMLYEHMTNAEFSTRFRWQPGSIAFWDNRATAHLVPTDIPPGMHRSMQRITIAGDTPVGPDGSTSYALEGAAFG